MVVPQDMAQNIERLISNYGKKLFILILSQLASNYDVCTTVKIEGSFAIKGMSCTVVRSSMTEKLYIRCLCRRYYKIIKLYNFFTF